MKRKKSRILLGIFVFILMAALFTAYIGRHFDGRKPSVFIDLKGIENGPVYVTLLAESADQYTVHEYKEPKDQTEAATGTVPNFIWEKFADFAQKEDFHLLAYIGKYDLQNPAFAWEYFAPKAFKILIYFPEQDKFVLGKQVIRNHLLESRYTAEVQGEQVVLSAKWDVVALEFLMFLMRLAISLGIKIMLAYLMFRFDIEWQRRGFLEVSLITQIAQHLIAGIAYLYLGIIGFYYFLILLHAIVLLVEGGYYTAAFREHEATKKEKLLLLLYVIFTNGGTFYATGIFQFMFLTVVY